MVKTIDGKPLISTALASLIIGALLAPSFGGLLWLRGWMSGMDEKMSVVIANQVQLRSEAYPRTEAQLEIRRLDQQDVNLTARMLELHQLRVDQQSRRNGYAEEGRGEMTRSLRTAIESAAKSDRGQADRALRPQ